MKKWGDGGGRRGREGLEYLEKAPDAVKNIYLQPENWNTHTSTLVAGKES